MKQFFIMLALIAGMFTANAQEDVRETAPTAGDLYEGFTRPLTFNRMIPPYGLEVTFTKLFHINIQLIINFMYKFGTNKL